ncbi:MAG: 3-phosphoserine/phosphohydroxythreonine transaminase [Chloroflexi bacterium]|nr:3-phosphoserine/phosphohydroxythreonine transaminase [Chloroflexota bacterium]
MSRTTNFYAGPSVLPIEVLGKIQEEILDYRGTGLSLMETSHRSQAYDEVHNEAVALLKDLLSIPDNFRVLFLGGGATLQFSMIPLNFLHGERVCDFTLSGTWSKKAYVDADKIGTAKIVFDGAHNGYSSLMDSTLLKVNPDAAYLHMTSNETIQGIQWKNWPETNRVPIVCDMSSDILSRPIPVEKFGMIYAGAQKNLGPSGVTIVIIREDMAASCPNSLPAYINYRTHIEKNSLYNTPPVFPIYAMKLVLERMKENGGLAAIVKHNQKKANLLYTTIEKSAGFYFCPVDPKYRSEMNVVFRLSDAALEKSFLEAATAHRMVGLKGHSSVGGCRASIYNSMTYDGVKRLADFMIDFPKKHKEFRK